MEDLMKDRDCMLINHKKLGKIMAGYYQGKFVTVDTFLKVDDTLNDDDIISVYFPVDGKLTEITSEKKFLEYYRDTKNSL